jgi:hypothetical protein
VRAAKDDIAFCVHSSGTAMDSRTHLFRSGDRALAKHRPEFPHGTVVQLLDKGFLVVHWDGELLETVHHTNIERHEGS